MKRLFIATKVCLNDECRKLSQDLQQLTQHDNITWVKNDVTHLTLRFLGQTPDSQIPLIKEAMEKAIVSFHPFSLQLDKLGFFGSRYAPSVIWLGFSEFEMYRQLFLSLEQQLQQFGFEAQQGNFVPHITLGRIKMIHNKKRFWETMQPFIEKVSQEIPIQEITLYQSKLNPEGPEYKALFTQKIVPLYLLDASVGQCSGYIKRNKG